MTDTNTLAAPAAQGDALDAARYRYLKSIAVQTADPLGPIFSITIRRIDQDGVWGNVSATIDAHIAAKEQAMTISTNAASVEDLQDTVSKALVEYANPLNWDVDENGIRRVWKEPGSETPEAYNGFELAKAALSTAAQPTAGIWVPTELAERVQETMGEFLMDHGWRQQDMDTSDEFGALLAVATKAEKDKS